MNTPSFSPKEQKGIKSPRNRLKLPIAIAILAVSGYCATEIHTVVKNIEDDKKIRKVYVPPANQSNDSKNTPKDEPIVIATEQPQEHEVEKNSDPVDAPEEEIETDHNGCPVGEICEAPKPNTYYVDPNGKAYLHTIWRGDYILENAITDEEWNSLKTCENMFRYVQIDFCEAIETGVTLDGYKVPDSFDPEICDIEENDLTTDEKVRSIASASIPLDEKNLTVTSIDATCKMLGTINTVEFSGLSACTEDLSKDDVLNASLKGKDLALNELKRIISGYPTLMDIYKEHFQEFEGNDKFIPLTEAGGLEELMYAEMKWIMARDPKSYLNMRVAMMYLTWATQRLFLFPCEFTK